MDNLPLYLSESELVTRLHRIANKDEPVSYQPGEPLGLQEVSLHCFRHTHSTQLYALGTDPKTMQSQLRHANSEITLGRYTHAVPELQKQAVEQLAEQLHKAEEKRQVFSNVLNNSASVVGNVSVVLN